MDRRSITDYCVGFVVGTARASVGSHICNGVYRTIGRIDSEALSQPSGSRTIDDGALVRFSLS